MLPACPSSQHPHYHSHQHPCIESPLTIQAKIGHKQRLIAQEEPVEKLELDERYGLPPWIKRLQIQHDPYHRGYEMPSYYFPYHIYDMFNFHHEIRRRNYEAQFEVRKAGEFERTGFTDEHKSISKVLVPSEDKVECKIQESEKLSKSLEEDHSPSDNLKIDTGSDSKKRSFHHIGKNKQRNQTKNIPKNYGKAMITFILERSDWIKMRLGSHIHNQLIAELKQRKSRINSIIHLKDLWTNSKYSTEFRILSNLFLRKHSFSYIFNSRVSNFGTHIKYKYKLSDAVRRPAHFKSIKEY